MPESVEIQAFSSILHMERHTGLEPAILCLGSREQAAIFQPLHQWVSHWVSRLQL